MCEVIGWIAVALFVLSILGVIDLTIDVSTHVDGEKVTCVRGKAG